LLGKDVYKGLLRGEWQPPSVEAITTVKPDAFGNPAGSDLRLFVQTSPPQRRVIQSFETDLGAPTLGPGVVAQHNSAGQLSGDALRRASRPAPGGAGAVPQPVERRSGPVDRARRRRRHRD